MILEVASEHPDMLVSTFKFPVVILSPPQISYLQSWYENMSFVTSAGEIL
jgi:hypothetical protein